MRKYETKQILKKGRKNGAIVYGASAYKVLKIIAGSAFLGIALTAFIAVPNLAVAAKPLLEYFRDRDKREWQNEKRNIRSAIERLQRRRLVKLIERKDGAYLVITEKGKDMIKKFEIESIRIQEPEEWNRKWHVVIFDIPEKYKTARDALRRKLRVVGFYSLQKSSFVYPHECRDEVDFISQFFGVGKYIQYLICDDLGVNEGTIRRHFNLLL